MTLNPVHKHELRAQAASIVGGSLKQKIVTGAAANTDIAVAGIATSDLLISVLNLTDLDTPTVPTIQSAGNIRCTSTTAGDKLLVTYYDVSG